MASPERPDDLVIEIVVDTSALESALSRIGELFTGGMAGAAAALSPMFASAVRAAEQEELRARAIGRVPLLSGHLLASLDGQVDAQRFALDNLLWDDIVAPVEALTAEPGLDAAAFDFTPDRCWKCDAKPGAEELDGACWRCWCDLTGPKRRERT